MSASAKDAPTIRGRLETIGEIAPGLLLSAALATAATALAPAAADVASVLFGRRLAVTPHALALVLGMVLHSVGALPEIAPGATFAIKRVLRLAIAALGAKILLADILSLGVGSLAMIVASLLLTFASAVALARLLGLGPAFGAIAGAATAICGASAALAISSTLPDNPKRQRDTAFVVIATSGLATVAMIVYPPLCAALGFDDRTTGLFLGTSIHDVAQVVGAGYSVSETAGNFAALAKLFRVALLLPIVVATGWLFADRQGPRVRGRPRVPVFPLAFLAVATLNSAGALSDPIRSALIGFSNGGVLTAMAALGLCSSPAAMLRLSGGHMFTVLGATLVAGLAPLLWLIAKGSS